MLTASAQLMVTLAKDKGIWPVSGASDVLKIERFCHTETAAACAADV